MHYIFPYLGSHLTFTRARILKMLLVNSSIQLNVPFQGLASQATPVQSGGQVTQRQRQTEERHDAQGQHCRIRLQKGT